MARLLLLSTIGSLLLYSSLAQTPEPRVVRLVDLLEEINKNDDSTRVFNFWATWCMPCVREFPYLMSYDSTIRNSSTKLILVSLDDPKKSKAKLNAFLEKRKVKSCVWVLDEGNPNAFIDAIEPHWQGSIPATLVISGTQRKFAEREFHSSLELDEWVQQIKK